MFTAQVLVHKLLLTNCIINYSQALSTSMGAIYFAQEGDGCFGEGSKKN